MGHRKSRLETIKTKLILSAAVSAVIVSLGGCNVAKMTTTTPPVTTSGTLSPSNSSLSFGNVSVGSQKTLTLSMTNTGSAGTSISISQLSASGAGFASSGYTLPIVLAGGQSYTVSVAFTPASAAAANGSISIVSDATDPNVSVPLSGTGTSAATLAVSPSSMSFGSINVGSSQNRSGTLTASSGAVSVTSAAWNGTGFSVSGVSFPVTLQTGQSVPFTVTFAPQSGGAVTGSVSFVSSASNSPSMEQWSGTGVQVSQHSAALTWNPSSGAISGYYVYRGGQSGGPYTKISPLQASAAYTDGTVVSGQTYFYVVTALGTNSVESAFSNEAVATIP